MRLTRIRKLRGYRVFRDFSWPTDLHDFGQFNVIYGWNGSGKTTLAAILRHVQSRSPIQEGDIEFLFDGRSVRGNDLATAAVPEVRVFDRDVIQRSVFESAAEMEPIFFLGTDSAEKQKSIEALRGDLKDREPKLLQAQEAVERSKKAVDDFCVQRAKLIKEVLLTSRAATYANYDKKRFKAAIERLDADSASAAALPEATRTQLKRQKDAQPKEAVGEVAVVLPNVSGLREAADAMLRRSVTSQVLKELAHDADLGAWVQRGLSFHTGPRDARLCLFCGQRIPASRITELEAHFNDTLARFQEELATLAERVEGESALLSSVRFPSPSSLYEHLSKEFGECVTETQAALASAGAYLDAISAALREKSKAPFAPMNLADSLRGRSISDASAVPDLIARANSFIRGHNDTTADFQRVVDRACAQLELAYVADAYPEYQRLCQSAASAQTVCTTAGSSVGALRERIAQLEREIIEHRRPAEELTADLAAYLGRSELQIEVKSAGYRILRGGQPATHLSEGEKTAIAFLYFLKSLRDRSFDIHNGIVVIDDPVSSLDANALYSAFGYLKERTKASGQLFILTHDFSFFRQVRSWFHHMPGQKKRDVSLRPARFFMLSAGSQEHARSAQLGPLDPLLEEHQSEYHYLFKRVHDGAHQTQPTLPLERQYEMPNVARRLLEAFLSFRIPNITGDLHAMLEQVDFDPAVKTRILRFLHTYSHHDSVAHPAHDLSILSETGAVLSDVLELMRRTDGAHYERMLETVATPGSP